MKEPRAVTNHAGNDENVLSMLSREDSMPSVYYVRLQPECDTIDLASLLRFDGTRPLQSLRTACGIREDGDLRLRSSYYCCRELRGEADVG